MNRPIASVLVALLTGAAAAAPPAHVLLRGESASSLELSRVVADGAPEVVLSEFEIISMGLSGWAQHRTLDDETARLFELLPGLHGVVAAGGDETTLLHYRREGGTRFGFVAVDRHGEVQPLLEEDGLGDLKLVDPFDPAVAVDEEGTRVAISALRYGVFPESVARTWIIGLGETTLADGVKSVSVNDVGGVNVPGSSLTFIESTLYAARGAAVVRAPWDGATAFAPVTLPPSAGVTPAFVVPEFILAHGDSKLAVLAGASEAEVDLYLFDAGESSITNVTDAPAWIQPPQTTWASDVGGPKVAIGEDGHCAYLVRQEWAEELFLASADAPGTAFHVTKEPTFEPYIDNVTGVLTGGARLVYIAASDHQNRADVFRTDGVVGESILTTNLTATSGETTPPFTQGSEMLVTERWAIGDSLLLVDDRTDYGEGFDLWTVSDLEDADRTVEDLAAAPRFSLPQHDGLAIVGLFETDAMQVVAVVGTEREVTSPIPVFALSTEWPVRALAIDRDARTILLAVELAPGTVLIGAIDFWTGQVTVTSGGPYADVQEVRFGEEGRILFSWRDPAGVQHASCFDPATGAEATHGTGAVASWLK